MQKYGPVASVKCSPAASPGETAIHMGISRAKAAPEYTAIFYPIGRMYLRRAGISGEPNY